jgi:ADP-ribose pyrophosphatase YjhB (NUDIX family)
MNPPTRNRSYCPWCGALTREQFIPKEKRLRRICVACSRIDRQNPVLVAGVIILVAGKVLLARRAEEPGLGKWNYPKGHVELEETVPEAAIRETAEEIGCTPELQKFLGVFSYRSSPVINVAYLGTITDTRLDFDREEVLELAWFSENDVPWGELAFEDDVDALRMAFAQ